MYVCAMSLWRNQWHIGDDLIEYFGMFTNDLSATRGFGGIREAIY